MFTFFYIFVYTYTCNDMHSVMLQINEYDDDAKYVLYLRTFVCCLLCVVVHIFGKYLVLIY